MRVKPSSRLEVLIAHEDQAICQQLEARLNQAQFLIRICRNPHEVVRWLKEANCCLLLLDVAFSGRFPFALIEQARLVREGFNQKVVLLASVYNKTAYKKRPTSLYGADGYLELHHIGDRLLPMVIELFPHLESLMTDAEELHIQGAERELGIAELAERTLSLARLLVADIVLYHQDRLQPGLPKCEAQLLFADFLQEGRQLLLQRLPESSALPMNYLQLAFDEFLETYALHYSKS